MNRKNVIIAVLIAVSFCAKAQTTASAKCQKCVQMPTSFAVANATKPTERTIQLTPAVHKGEEPTKVDFKTLAETIIAPDKYIVELPELTEREEITIYVMIDQYVFRKWTVKAGGESKFKIDLSNHQKLFFQLSETE